MAQSRHAQCAEECPLLGVKRTFQIAIQCPLMTLNGRGASPEGWRRATLNPLVCLEMKTRMGYGLVK
jgi:hypothetical protein